MKIRRERLARTRFVVPAFARLASALGLAVVLASACDKLGFKEPRQSASGGEIDDSFEPAKIKSVKGVPVAEVRSAIQKRLGEARPKPITEEQWKHAKNMYAQFGGAPIWLDGDGIR